VIVGHVLCYYWLWFQAPKGLAVPPAAWRKGSSLQVLFSTVRSLRRSKGASCGSQELLLIERLADILPVRQKVYGLQLLGLIG